MAWVKRIYLYVVSLISLVILVVAAIMLINLALKAWVFTKADDAYNYAPKIMCDAPAPAEGEESMYRDPACDNPNYEADQREDEKNRREAQQQQQAAQALAMVIVATPVFLYHWKLTRKEA